METLSPECLDRVARSAASGISFSRLILGRALLAIQRSQAYKRYGCAGGALHYASAQLAVDYHLASESRLVALRLEELPLLTEAAESGSIGWSALRTVTPVCTVENEAEWLGRARSASIRTLESMVRGHQAALDKKLPTGPVRVKFWLQAEGMALFRRACRSLCRKAGRRLSPAKCLEALCAHYLTGSAFPEAAAEEKLRQAARRDVRAERERQEQRIACAVGAEEFERATTGVATQREEAAAADVALEESDRQDPAGQAPAGETAEATGLSNELEVDWTLCSGLSPVAVPPRIHSRTGPIDLEQAIPRPLPLAAVAAGPRSQVADSAAPDSSQGEEASSWRNPRLRFNGAARLLTEAQREEILRRDGYSCSAPGCPNQLWLEIHHIVPFSRGGLTVPENLLTVCSACHRALHRGELHLQLDSARAESWADSRGRPLTVFQAEPVAEWLMEGLETDWARRAEPPPDEDTAVMPLAEAA